MTTCLFVMPLLTARLKTSPHFPSLGTLSARFISILIISQCIRIVMFLSTTLPGPHPNCRPDSLFYSVPLKFSDIFNPFYFFNSSNCGDGVFSMKILFYTLCCVMFYKYYNYEAVSQILYNLSVRSGGYDNFSSSNSHFTIGSDQDENIVGDDQLQTDRTSQNSINFDSMRSMSMQGSNVHPSIDSLSDSTAQYERENKHQFNEYDASSKQSLGEMLPMTEYETRSLDNSFSGLLKRYLPISIMIIALLITSITQIADRYHFSLNIFAAWFTVVLVYIALEEHYPDFPEEDPEEYAQS